MLETLRRDLTRLRDEQGLRPDLIFFTGDAAFGHLGDGGGKSLPEQFAEAEEFFVGVREICNVPQEDFFLVPGNHDVHRGNFEPLVTKLFDSLQHQDITKLIEETGPLWKLSMKRLADYHAFLEDHGYGHLLADPDRLVWAQKRQIRDLRVGIAGFNTAWSCCRDSEKGQLWAGSRWQREHLAGLLAGDAPGEGGKPTCASLSVTIPRAG